MGSTVRAKQSMGENTGGKVVMEETVDGQNSVRPKFSGQNLSWAK